MVKLPLKLVLNLGVTSKLNELQDQLNRSAANLSQEQEKRLEQTLILRRKLMNPRKIKN